MTKPDAAETKLRVSKALTDRIEVFLREPQARTRATAEAIRALPRAVADEVSVVMTDRRVSYPLALAIQLAFAVVAGVPLDIRERRPGARGTSGVAGRVDAFLREHHIPSVQDAFQNIGKNSSNLVRGNFPEFDSLLQWGASANATSLRAALDLVAAALAGQSRPVEPMPELNQSALSFAAVVGLFRAMLDTPSEGSHEQFIVGAILHALVSQTQPHYRVDTKRLNASDASSQAAGDVQIFSGTRIIEAVEVTANDWRSKIDPAANKAKEHDLARYHILAKVPAQDRNAVLDAVQGLPIDLSVVDLSEFVVAVVLFLTKSARADSLRRLYELLDRMQPDTSRVNEYVRRLRERSLTE